MTFTGRPESPATTPFSNTLARARGESESAATEKLIARIHDGKLDRPALLAAAGFYVVPQPRTRDERATQKRPERDVMAAAIEALPAGAIDYLDSIVGDYTEQQVLTMLDRGLPRDVTVRMGGRGATLLGFAALRDYCVLAERLIGEGADPNAMSRSGYLTDDPRPHRQRPDAEPAHPLRPLDFAWAGGSARMREVLARAGATETDRASMSAAFGSDFGSALWDGLCLRLDPFALPHTEVKVATKPEPGAEARLCSRFGGAPNLDPEAWPEAAGEKMLFVGQLHLPELKQPPLPLPSTGVLCFFVSAGHHEVGRVVFQPEATAKVTVGPSLLKGCYPMKLTRPKQKQLPMENNHYWEALAGPSLENAETNPYVRRAFDLADEGCHQIGGHPFLIQSDPRPRYAREHSIPDVHGILPLLQIDQFPKEGMLWGDNGIAHFFCHVDAIRARRFEEASFHRACF